MKYTNPVIPGFYPDPSICRTGNDFYLVTSTFEYFPGVPVFHSKDLVHWRQIGHCLTRESQLCLKGMRSSGGIYAPTIRCYNNTFYLITTNYGGTGHFYVTARDPAGEWSEPTWVKGELFDPSLYFDDSGKVYLNLISLEGILQTEIDLQTGKYLADVKLIWSGMDGLPPEAPHLYKINGFYYLLVAAGGTEYGHLSAIARSRSPWGPFEDCPYNPVLTHRSMHRGVHCVGHADLVEDGNGNWWAVFLGVRAGYPGFHHLGRETFLAPVAWTDVGWPVIGNNGTVDLTMEAECLPFHPWDEEKIRDDFKAPELRICWNFLRNPYEKDWNLTERPGWLCLRGSAITLNDKDSPAFVGRRQRHFDCRVRALLDFTPRKECEEAGLAVRMDERHHYEIAVTRFNGNRRFIVRRRIGGLSAIVASENIPENGYVELGINAKRDKYAFFYALEGMAHKTIAEGETRYLSSEVAGGCTGVYLAMYATGNGQQNITPAFFDWFEYAPGT